MRPPHKKKRARIGRPPKTRIQKDADARRYAADGERLRKALGEVGLSVAKASRDTGLRQVWISQIIQGERPLGREDLRALGKLGISADYLLGAVAEPVTTRSTRSRAHLEVELANHVERELTRRFPADQTAADGDDEYFWRVRPTHLLDAAVASVEADARVELALFAERRASVRDSDAIRIAVNKLMAVHDASGSSDPESLSAMQTLLEHAMEMEGRSMNDALAHYKQRPAALLVRAGDLAEVRAAQGGLVANLPDPRASRTEQC